MANFWLIKSEPASYSWEDLLQEGETVWNGVRNHRAAGNLRKMEVGDEALFYHSVTGKQIVGIAVVSEAGILDPTDPDQKWAAVKVKPLTAFARPVSLAEIKAEPALENCELVRLSRLSVAQLTAEEWQVICEMGAN